MFIKTPWTPIDPQIHANHHTSRRPQGRTRGLTPGLLQRGPETLDRPREVFPLPRLAHASLLKDLRGAPRVGQLSNHPLGELHDGWMRHVGEISGGSTFQGLWRFSTLPCSPRPPSLARDSEPPCCLRCSPLQWMDPAVPREDEPRRSSAP